MMKRGGGVLYKISAEFEFGAIAHWVRTPKMWRWATTLGKSAQAV